MLLSSVWWVLGLQKSELWKRQVLHRAEPPTPAAALLFPPVPPLPRPPPQASEAQGERGMMNLSAGLHRALTQPRATERSVGDSADLFQTLLIFGGSKGTRVISS